MILWTITSTDERGKDKTVTDVEVTRVRKGVYISNIRPTIQCSYEEEAAFFAVLIQLRFPSAATRNGQGVCVVRPRYTFGGLTTIGYPVTMGMIRADGLGWRADTGESLNNTFQTAMDHMRKIASAEGRQITKEERDIASRASSRATLAIMKLFRLRCIRNHVKEKAAMETPMGVEISMNGGTWDFVDGNGDSWRCD